MDDVIVLGELKQRVLHTEEKLTEIKVELRDLNISIKELNSTIANMGKPKWQVLLGAGTLICLVTGGIWTLVITPLSDRVKAIESTYVPKDTHLERWAQEKEDLQRIENSIKDRVSKDDFNRLIIDIDKRLGRK